MALVFASGTAVGGYALCSRDLLHVSLVSHARACTRFQIALTFSHQYPAHLRAGVRTICGVLLILTALYVVPHLFDVGSPAAHAPAPPLESFYPSGSSGMDEFGDVRPAAGVGAWPRGGSRTSAANSVPPFSTVSKYSLSNPSAYLSPASKLARELERMLAWPWPWLWPWSLTSRVTAPPPPPARFGDDFDVDPVPPPVAVASDKACPAWCTDEDLCAASSSAPPDASQAAANLFQVRLYQCGVLYGSSPTAVWREHGLAPAGPQHVPKGHQALCSPPGSRAGSAGTRPKPASAEGTRWFCDGSTRACPTCGFLFPVASRPGLWPLLCLYVKLHFKRQVHYLRLGVVILFTLTGAVWCYACVGTHDACCVFSFDRRS